MTRQGENLVERLKAQAAALGFADCAIARADAAPETAARLVQWLSERSEEHTSELQSLMRISYAVFCLKNTSNEKDRKRTDPTQRRTYQNTHYITTSTNE